MVYLTLIYQALTSLHKIQNPEFANIIQKTSFMSLKAEGRKDYAATQMKLLHIIRKGNKYDLTQDELKPYLEVGFTQKHIDWYKPVSDGRFTEAEYKARDCRREDFGVSAYDQALFDDWAGFRLYCPDIPEGSPLFLEGK